MRAVPLKSSQVVVRHFLTVMRKVTIQEHTKIKGDHGEEVIGTINTNGQKPWT